MHQKFRGDVTYQAETDVHFPHLTVGQTLQYAALARTPHNRLSGVSRETYATHLRDVVMAVFGISHTINTKVGDDFIRGVSGGERKRVSIAELALTQSCIQCWDNSTRGLDSATALEFVRTVRLSVDVAGTAAVVALYQASQQSYDVCSIPFPLHLVWLTYLARSLIRLHCYTRAGKYILVQLTKRSRTSQSLVTSVLNDKPRQTFSRRSQILSRE